MPVSDFIIDIPEYQIDDLRYRLDHVRTPGRMHSGSWEEGVSPAFMSELINYWRHSFNWKVQQQRLNKLPHFRTKIAGIDLHFIHLKGRGRNPMPLILTHGWPGSFAEMEKIIPLLVDPEATGANPLDAFDVVIPSLPGFGFSSAPKVPGCSARFVAGMWHKLMRLLGYSRFAAQGGDIGASVSAWLGRDYPDDIQGIHLNYVPGSYQPSLDSSAPPMSAEERGFLARSREWFEQEGAYEAEHTTKPQTLAYAMADSPVGLAAWIVEKFYAWSDCDGDITKAFSYDELLTNISLYWFSNQIDATFRIYKENAQQPLHFHSRDRITVPVGVAHFPYELPMPPRSWVERSMNICRWSQMPRGGHFAAHEQPELLAAEIREFFRPLRED